MLRSERFRLKSRHHSILATIIIIIAVQNVWMPYLNETYIGRERSL